MSKGSSVNLRRLILILVLLLLVSVLLFFWLRDVIREVIVLPISYLLFVTGIIVDTAPQLFFWLAILLIAFWIAYRSLSTRRRAVLPPAAPVLSDTFDRNPYGGRVAFWSSKVNQMRTYRSDYYRSTFHYSLARLLIELLAHRYRLTMLETEERLRSGMLEVPAEIREYVLSSLSRRDIKHENFLSRFRKSIIEKIRRLFSFRSESFWKHAEISSDNQAEAQIARIIRYMEEELEVTHDHSS